MSNNIIDVQQIEQELDERLKSVEATHQDITVHSDGNSLIIAGKTSSWHGKQMAYEHTRRIIQEFYPGTDIAYVNQVQVTSSLKPKSPNSTG